MKTHDVTYTLETLPPVSEEDIRRAQSVKDEDIDYSDIPALDPKDWKVGGFPSDGHLSARPNLNWNAKDIIRTTHDKDGNLLMPAAWRDDED